MSELTMQANLPWSVSHPEDSRFRWILAQTLAVSLALGVIIPYARIPQPDAGIEQELPPRRVRLLAEQPRPALRPVAQPVAQTAIEKAPVVPAQTARQAVAMSGVLAMGDALAELRAREPRSGTKPARENTDPALSRTAPQTSTLTAGVTRGSGGIDVGVSHQSVLGAAGLAQREEVGQGSSSGERSGAARGRPSSAPPGLVRTQEEIQEMLDRNKGAMYTLYNHELREDAGLQGKLVVSITIAPAGNVTRCVILSSELGSASLERQLVALIGRIDFGNKPGTAVVTTKIPIEFFPR